MLHGCWGAQGAGDLRGGLGGHCGVLGAGDLWGALGGDAGAWIQLDCKDRKGSWRQGGVLRWRR